VNFIKLMFGPALLGSPAAFARMDALDLF